MRHVQALAPTLALLSLAGCHHREKDHSLRYASPSPSTTATTGTGSTPGFNPNTTPGASPATSPNPGPVSNGMTIGSFEPQQGLPGGRELLVVTGSGFSDNTVVTVAGVRATRLLSSATQIVVSTGAGTGAGPVEVVEGTRNARSGAPYRYAAPATARDSHFQAGTDKWFIQLPDADGNGQTDLIDALATAMNNQGGTGFPDTELALTELFRALNVLYRNGASGTVLTSGAPLSFQLARPRVGTSPAQPGAAQVPDTVVDHNLMAIRNVAYLGNGLLTSGVVGTANLENRSNNLLDNNSGVTAGDPLGIWIDANVYWWNQSGIPNSRRTVRELMEEVAIVLAHEVGHSLGLDHVETAPAAPATVNIMSATSTVDVDNVYAFDTTTWNAMQAWLPGTNRCSHRASWTPRRLLAEADAVVLATPMQLQRGALEMQVSQVLAGSVSTGMTQVSGFSSELSLGRAQLAPGEGAALMFLTDGPGGLQAGLGEATAVSMEGRDVSEWTALIAEYRALDLLTGDAWRARCGEILTHCLGSADERIRVDALVDLSTNREVVRALSAAQMAAVSAGLDAESAFERCLAAQVLLHRADPAQAATLLQAGLSEDDPAVLADIAGALEMSLGLTPAAAAVRAKLPLLDAASAARAQTLLGWLE